MFELLAITTPVYLAMGAGYCAVRFGLFQRSEMQVLGRFVLYFGLSSMLFDGLHKRQFSQILNPTYLLACALGTLTLLGLSFWWARRHGQQSVSHSACISMGMVCPNSGFVGFPILVLLLPQVAGLSTALNQLIENILILPILMTVAQAGSASANRSDLLRATLRSLMRNPMIIGLTAGLTVSLTGIPIPQAVSRSIAIFAQASSAVALFAIGGTLFGLHIGQLKWRIAPILLGKLVLHPLAVAAALWLLVGLGMPPLERPLRDALLLLAAMPMMSIYPILAHPYGQQDLAAASLLGATVGSFFTLNVLIWLLHFA
jgi:malonate transporter and related proteins